MINYYKYKFEPPPSPPRILAMYNPRRVFWGEKTKILQDKNTGTHVNMVPFFLPNISDIGPDNSDPIGVDITKKLAVKK